jgi:mono/diheme cytochrome c family protein
VNSAKIGVLTVSILGMIGAAMPAGTSAQAGGQVTFTKDIAPILQRSCQNCHRPSGVAPMSLITYEDVRPWARSIKQRTGLRNRMGVMPPWFIDKSVGIQDYKDDFSLSEAEIATIAKWVDGGALRGNPADMPPPRVFAAADVWDIGQPDLVVDSPPVTMKANAPDWWSALPAVPTGLTEDRYVSAIQFKEISSVQGGTGGRFIFHHAIHALVDAKGLPAGSLGSPHEVGRNAETFEPDAARLMKAGSELAFPSIHMHANSEDTTARLRVAFKFQPRGYTPQRRLGQLTLGNGEIDLKPNTAGQEVHFYATLPQHTKLTTFEPHMHAAGVRMCLEAVWGGRSETLSCSGYDHNWVRVYKYGDDAAPLLPRGTLLHVTAYFDTTSNNRNVVDPRNWGGLGHRSIDNMAILIAPTITLSDDEFKEEIAMRRKKLNLAKGQSVLGCPLCGFEDLPPMLMPSPTRTGAGQGQQQP